MVDASYEIGTEVIKYRIYVFWNEVSKAAKKVLPANIDVYIYDVMAGCVLNKDDEIKLKEYVKSKGMIFHFQEK